MNRDEAIYWGTNRDSNDNRIKQKHKYSIESTDLDTRWWCITVYRNCFFIPNKYKRYSFSKTDINRKDDRSWVIKISTEEQSGNWIPLGDKKGDIRITLRCYNPGRSMIENGENANLPKIIRRINDVHYNCSDYNLDNNNSYSYKDFLYHIYVGICIHTYR